MLDTLRKKIDDTDRELISLLAKRIALVKKVGRYKKQHELPALDATRWQSVLLTRRRLAKAKGINEHFIELLFEAIHEEALRIEKDI